MPTVEFFFSFIFCNDGDVVFSNDNDREGSEIYRQIKKFCVSHENCNKDPDFKEVKFYKILDIINEAKVTTFNIIVNLLNQ